MNSEKINGTASAAFGGTPKPLKVPSRFNLERSVNTLHINTSTLQA
jgi:hypothetical protein